MKLYEFRDLSTSVFDENTKVRMTENGECKEYNLSDYTDLVINGWAEKEISNIDFSDEIIFINLKEGEE